MLEFGKRRVGVHAAETIDLERRELAAEKLS